MEVQNMYPVQEQSIGFTPAPVDQTTDQKQRRLVIKHQNQFLLLDLTGGMRAKNGAGLGLYVNDTRFLSQWEMTVGGEPLHFLTADAEEGFAATLTYHNRAFGDVPEGSISVKREIVVDETEIVNEMITLQNFLRRPIDVTVKLAFAADFADMFEVRGSKRLLRGALLPIKRTRGDKGVALRYLGQDSILRQTRISFVGRQATELNEGEAIFSLKQLAPQETVVLQARISTAETVVSKSAKDEPTGPETLRPVQNHGRRFDFARTSAGQPLARARRAHDQWGLSNARISTGNSDFNRLLVTSYRDIYLLRQNTVHGTAVAAGVPWFAVPFGRDSLIAGLQTLPFMPQLSRDILQFLAAYQGKKHDQETCEKPGRIMHELRPGEMAGLAEIPFRPYFGTVDATPLWLMLYARYVQWTGDLDFARKLWPNARAALNSLAPDKGQKLDFLTYGGQGNTALSNQGWKDSGNCIVYSNGELAKAPIAVCEAQGYLYAAWREVAAVAEKLGLRPRAALLTKQAKEFKAKFNSGFWMPEHSTAALALDGAGRQCDVVASNAGHLLGTGILPPERERLVAERLMRDDMFSGWGIRTLAESSAAYQPMDYQVGAVWPHDNGIIANGMCLIGESTRAHTVIKAMLDVSLSQSDMRLPELFDGFKRDNTRLPIPYQVACVPQLWAAGCAFHMVAGLLGLSYDADSKTLKVTKPSLPAWLGHVQVDGLKMGDAEVNLTFHCTASGATTVEITRVRGDVRCLVEC
jgi:glycogen debranching enzyme